MLGSAKLAGQTTALAIDQNELRLRILDDMSRPLFRIRRIQHHTGFARLNNRENSHHNRRVVIEYNDHR
ncbi:MAG: hypothetical protein AUI36_42485 [Cyanobacteria bacterium 13_1_40CM_2_61_4]|nr:MAG: hypothetical protein AUI36_42485 [Cyanobacteria bacterium 13_1_40CM_2_61_4]